ncbi:MAG: alpha/beta hydrolase [Actinobacteria bacterium]|nr:alpha/beta hydrolase [Actinomycetota bacterium]
MPKPPSHPAAPARLSDATLPAVDEAVHIWPGHHVDVGAARVHVRTTPSANAAVEPALFVHGLGGSAHNWTDLAGILRDRFAIESIDLLGHGRSGPAPRNDYSLGAQVRTVIGYLEQSARGPVHLVGNSMGGAISALVAAQRPDLVRTLTLVSPAVPDNRVRAFPLRNDPRAALLAVPGVGEVAIRRYNQRFTVEQRVKGTIKLCFAEPSRYPVARRDEAIAEARARAAMPWAEAAVLRSMRGLGVWQFLRSRSGWAALRSITAPTLVLWGDTDRLVAPDLAPYVAAAIPGARLLVLEHVGHTAMMEVPAATARAFLALTEDAAALRT